MSSLKAQTKTLTWGASKSIDFLVGATGFTPPATGLQSAQLVRVVTDEPVVWLMQVLVDLTGFAGEAATTTVVVQTQVGVGQSMATLSSGTSVFTFAPPYTPTPGSADVQQFDQGFIPAASLNVSAYLTSSAPYTVLGDHRAQVSVFVAPWNNMLVEHERRAASLTAEALRDVLGMRR